VSIGESVTVGIRLCHRPIRIILIALIILFPVNIDIALEVIEQMFEHDESLTQFPDGRQCLAVCCNHNLAGHIHNPVNDIIDMVVAKHKKLQFVD